MLLGVCFAGEKRGSSPNPGHDESQGTRGQCAGATGPFHPGDGAGSADRVREKRGACAGTKPRGGGRFLHFDVQVCVYFRFLVCRF